MPQKRIERVYVDNGYLMVASFCSYDACPQIFDPDKGSLFLLAKQINVMLEEAEQRGMKNGIERGAEACLAKCLETIRSMGNDS